MKRKHLSLLLSGVLAVAALTGCSQAPEHTHAAGTAWDWNGTEHWHLCECGEKLDTAAHALDDLILCTDCGVELWDMGDGCVDGISYDENGDLLRMASFNADGEMISELRWERTYDANNRLLKTNCYVDGFLQDEEEYAVSDNGEVYMLCCTSHDEDGSYGVHEYDENGNLVAYKYYEADGTMSYESYSEYALTEDGEFYEAKSTSISSDGEKYVYEYNAYGDSTYTAYYTADGTLDYEFVCEYDYDENGDPLWEKQYLDGVLIYEVTAYAVVSDEEGYCRYTAQTIEYNEDGSKLVCDYGDNTDVAMETLYNADGSVAYAYTYTYEDTADGGWSVCVTDQNGEIISQVTYDCDGNEIE